MLFIWYLGRMYKPMRELSKMTDAYSKAAIGFERIREVLETERQINDLPGASRARLSEAESHSTTSPSGTLVMIRFSNRSASPLSRAKSPLW